MSPPRRRRSAAHAREPAPPVPAAEPVEPAPPVMPVAVPAFPPALFEQLVHRVATEVTKQLQPPSSSPAVQEPRVASPASAALPSFTGTAAIQQLTTEIPVVNSSALDPVVPSVSVGTAAAVDHVAQVVQSVHSTLAGEEPSPGAVQPKEVFTSINLPVDARVPLKLKTKIWQNEFIDFGLLLANQFSEGKYQLTFNSGDGSVPSLALEPVTKPKKIESFDSWVQAFHVFAGVYTSRLPCDGPGLMKYGSTIQDFAAKGLNWRFYDENFATDACYFPSMGYHSLGALAPLTKPGECKEAANPCQHWKACPKSLYSKGFLFFLP